MIGTTIIYLFLIIRFILVSPEIDSNGNDELPSLPTQVELKFFPSNPIAGDSVILSTNIRNDKNTSEFLLLVNHSWGHTGLKSIAGENTVQFLIDPTITNKAGEFKVSLFQDDIVLASQTVYIKPIMTNSPNIESYHGPRSIKAGGEEYSMVVSTLLDSLDNPYEAGTRLAYSFMDNLGFSIIEKETKEFYSFQNRYSGIKDGRILAHVTHGTSGTAQKIINVVPSLAVDFRIKHERMHPYADGFTPVRFITSPIMDKYGNIIVDGTLVEFVINGSNGSNIITTGTTKNGIAKVEFPAPQNPQKWQIKAFISLISESNQMSMTWYPAIEEIPVSFEENSNILIVGPLKSRFNNLLPDGTNVTVSYEDKKDTAIYKAGIRNGMARIELSDQDMVSGPYNLHVESCGITTEIINNESK